MGTDDDIQLTNFQFPKNFFSLFNRCKTVQDCQIHAEAIHTIFEILVMLG